MDALLADHLLPRHRIDGQLRGIQQQERPGALTVAMRGEEGGPRFEERMHDRSPARCDGFVPGCKIAHAFQATSPHPE
ncbi:hypothetical protein ACQR5U_16535 [Xanthomonas oryzae pv. oryzicola]|uniref:hypothetical protein n=1 Tax=Xanthomonas oryzae TaxID=347 RepID=UPI003D162EF5